MLLILTNSDDATADYLVSRISSESIDYQRFDTDTMISNISIEFNSSVCALNIEKKVFIPSNFSVVWYRRPEELQHALFDGTPEGRFAQSEWSESLEGFFAQIHTSKWMNHPASNVMASHKIEQLVRAQSIGLRVPGSLVTQDPGSLRRFYDQYNGRIIAKPLAGGFVDRPTVGQSTLIYTNRVELLDSDDLSDLSVCPTLFQEEIEKLSDVRITIVEHEIHAVELIAKDRDGFQRCDIRRNDMEDVEYRRTQLPSIIEDQVLRLVQSYGLRFAAIDMAISLSGEWYFFEVNPNGQWAWMDLEGHTDIASSFIRAFKIQ